MVDRDYTKLYEKFISLGDGIARNGLGAHGNHYMCEDVYQDMIDSNHFPVEKIDDKIYPSIKEDLWAANAVMKSIFTYQWRVNSEGL